jgi:hypothetical protein
VGWSDLGWAANFFVCPRLGHQTKTHACLLQKIKILITKLPKLSNANDAIEASKKWSNDSKYNELERSSVS